MITVMKIMDAVNDLILQKYPSCTFYIQDIPKDFERPSFYIEYTSGGTTNVNKSTYSEEVSLQIVHFPLVDDHRIAESIHLLDVCEQVKNIFRQGHIFVEERAVKITDITGSPRDNEVYLSVSLEFYESRLVTEEQIPLINQIYIVDRR